ncbi:methyl-accepting chemotaxis (MCP) signaling domain protein, partial [Vibrio parahaemolyticus VP-48]
GKPKHRFDYWQNGQASPNKQPVDR